MKSIYTTCLLLAITVFGVSPNVGAQEDQGQPAADQAEAERPADSAAAASVPEPQSPGDRGQLRFNFSGTNWRDVLEWFADEADLSLQVDQAPLGTFTFADPTRSYSVSEALDVLNLTLMKTGYILVRRGRILQVIDLEIQNADKLISEIAEQVLPEDLDERGKSDIVSCLFSLGSLTPTAAKEELALMVGPWGRVIVLDTARQVQVTETASKLIAIRELLKTAAMADSNVVEIILKHRGADEVLEIARPLLGLESGVNANDDVRISVGLFGDRIYAAGLPGKTGLLQSIVDKADQPLVNPDAGDGAELALPVFQTHSVRSADSSTVFDVLQTLLAGTPDARIAIDPKTNAIIAWARPETHRLIDSSIAEMEGTGQNFKVIDLRRLDPTQALLTINKFFGVTDTGGEGPIVDGDPATGKLWIRGTNDQIELVEKLLTELEGRDSLGGLNDKVRLLPYTGRAAEDALQQVESLWPVTGRKNQIRTFTPNRSGGENQRGSGGGLPERRVPRPENRPVANPDTTEASTKPASQYYFVSDQNDATAQATAAEGDDTEPARAQPASGSSSLVMQNRDSDQPSVTVNVDGADIVVQITPAGMIIASEDPEALDAFQSLIESLAAPSALQSDLPTIIWLKYIKADVAAELISSVLGGGEGSISSAVDSVTGGLGGGMLGLLGMGGGGGGSTSGAKSILTTSGSVNIVPDPRLNALIVQANAIDMQMIELILEKVDREESPEDIQTESKPALIPVIYQNAKDVADVVKSVFGERIAGAQSSARGGGGGGGQPSPQDFIAALRGGGGGRGGGGREAATSEPSKISIAVDVKSNSLVVIATPQDFNEVRELVQALDYSSQPSEEIVEIAPLRGDVNPEVIKLALESILGRQTSSTASSSTSPGGATATTGTTGAPDPGEIQRRIEAFRAMRGGGDTGGGGFRGFGGGGTGGFRGFGGGAPGGGFGGRGGGGGAPGGGGGRGGR